MSDTKERMEKMYALGLCKCGKPIERGKRCKPCIDYMREYARKRSRSRTKAGLCLQCGDPRTDKFLTCTRCRNRNRQYRRDMRLEVIDAYGGPICVCCGEKERKFLCIDHVNNDGSSHRKEVQGGMLYNWLKKNNYPKGFQVLCCNCNFGKHLNGGICPHADSSLKSS